jgi:hypothetical protein
MRMRRQIVSSSLALFTVGAMLGVLPTTMQVSRAQAPRPTPTRQPSSCIGVVSPTLSADNIRSCDTVTVTARTAAACPACPGGVNVVFSLVVVAGRGLWMGEEATSALQELKNYQAQGGLDVEVAVVEFGSTRSSGPDRRTLLELTDRLDRAQPHFPAEEITDIYGVGSHSGRKKPYAC